MPIVVYQHLGEAGEVREASKGPHILSGSHVKEIEVGLAFKLGSKEASRLCLSGPSEGLGVHALCSDQSKPRSGASRYAICTAGNHALMVQEQMNGGSQDVGAPRLPRSDGSNKRGYTYNRKYSSPCPGWLLGSASIFNILGAINRSERGGRWIPRVKFCEYRLIFECVVGNCSHSSVG